MAGTMRHQAERLGRRHAAASATAALRACGSARYQGLSDASIIGVAYGEAWAEEIERRVPMVTLIAQHADPLKEAFETFHAWAESTDADALELTFVFRTSGGYVLALSPEA